MKFKFQASTPRVAAGKPVTITFENEGTLEHNLHLEATGTHLVAPAGQTVTATVVFPSAADLSFVCTVPGHEAAGMSSKLQVGEPNAQAPAAINATAQTTPQTALAPLPPDTPRVPQGPVAPPVHRSDSELVKVNLAIEEVVGQLADGVGFRYWTFGGTVPGPMIRVRQGDTVELTLTNPPGMEPPQGFPPVDREFYVMQSEAYLQGDPAAAGLHDFAFDKLLHEQPDYVMYNGSVGSLTDERAMLASVGERVRFFFGVGGPNLDSAFHVVGLAWDLVHPEGAAEALTDVQTTLVPPGGATMTELTLTVPGLYMLEDHHITRLEKGAFAHFQVQGADSLAEFEQNAHHDSGTPVPVAPDSPFTITEQPQP